MEYWFNTYMYTRLYKAKDTAGTNNADGRGDNASIDTVIQKERQGRTLRRTGVEIVNEREVD